MNDGSVQPFSKDLAAFNEAIDSVDASTHNFMWKRHRLLSALVYGIAFGVAAVFAVIEIIYFDPRALTRDSLTGAIMLPLLPLLVPFFYYASVQARIAPLFKRQLADAIGFAYAESAPMSTVSGRIFEFGYEQRLSDIYSGKLGAYPMRFYTYSYVTGSGKSSSSWYFTVGEVDYGRKLPHLLLHSRKNRLYGKDWGFAGNMALTLEGGFSDSFEYFAEDGNQIEALEVLEPNIMALFQDTYPDFGFETFGTKLYVYCPRHGVNTKKGFIGLHELLSVLGSRLVPELGDVSARSQQS